MLEKDTGGVALRGVILVRGSGVDVGGDGAMPRDGFVVEQAVDQETEPADVRLKQNHPSTRPQDPLGFFQKQRWRFQMVKNVKKDEMRQGVLCERHLISITDQVQPGVGKEISRDDLRQ